MDEFVVADAFLLLDALICGMVIAVVYDVLRIYRNIVPHFNIIVGIEDFIFWNIAGIYLFAVMFGANDGIVRGFFLLGAILGAILYKKSLGELLVRYISNGINYLINIVLKKPINKVIMKLRKRKENANGKVCKEKAKSTKNQSDHKKKRVK